jgi:hypothetical protein
MLAIDSSAHQIRIGFDNASDATTSWLVGFVKLFDSKTLKNIVEYIPQLYLHPTMPFMEGHGSA